jgi:hypothetical protein
MLWSEASAGVDNKHYVSFGGKLVDQFSGWYELLNAITSQTGWRTREELRRNGYRALMLWAPNGVYGVTGEDYYPSFIRNLPSNLANTLNEIKDWEEDNSIRIFLWAGRSFDSYHTGSWNSTIKSPYNGGFYSSDGSILSGYTFVAPQFDPTSWSVGTVKDEAKDEFTNNIHKALDYFSGMGLDALPEIVNEPAILSELIRLRENHPIEWLAGESQKTDKGCQYFAPYYFPDRAAGNFSGYYEGRCPLLERIYPGYEGVVHVDEDKRDLTKIADIEAAGNVPMIMGTPVFATYAGRETTIEEDIVDMCVGMGINTKEKIQKFRSLPTNSGTMEEMIRFIQIKRGLRYYSRRRIRAEIILAVLQGRIPLVS